MSKITKGEAQWHLRREAVHPLRREGFALRRGWTKDKQKSKINVAEYLSQFEVTAVTLRIDMRPFLVQFSIQRNDSPPKCHGGRLRPVTGPQFGENMTDVLFYGYFGDMQCHSNFFVGLPTSNQLKNSDLAVT